jgi:hypothetical protein
MGTLVDRSLSQASQLPQGKAVQDDRVWHGKGRDHYDRKRADKRIRVVKRKNMQWAWRTQRSHAHRDREIGDAEQIP